MEFAAGEDVGYIPYGFADKLLRSALAVCFILLLYRLTVTLGLEVISLRRGGRRLPEILKTMFGLVYALISLVVLLYIGLEGKVSGILTLSGAIGVVVGLALRPIILDVFSGLSVNLEAAFQIGDWVSVEGGDAVQGSYVGWVEQINWRTTHIRTRSGNLAVCPNSYLSTSIVTNSSRPNPLSRYDIRVKIAQEISTDRASALLERAVFATQTKENGPSQNRKPDVLVSNMTGSGIEYWVRFWLDPAKDSYDHIIDNVSRSIHNHLRMAGIPIASDREHVYHARIPGDRFNPEDLKTRIELIRGLEVFSGLSAQSLEDLARAIRVERYHAEQTIMKQGGGGTSMYILTQGGLTVSMRSDDNEIHLGQLNPGDIFGEMSLLTGEPRSATITCQTDCTVLVISRSVMQELMQTYGASMQVISSNLAQHEIEREAAIKNTNSQEKEEEQAKLQTVILEKMKRLFRP